MLVIDTRCLDQAAEMLCIAARRATDEKGLKVSVNLPFRRVGGDGPLANMPTLDEGRVRAVTLAAIVSLTGEVCRVSGEIHLSQFPAAE